MADRGGPSTLAYLAKQAQSRAKTAMALRITPTPTATPLAPDQPATLPIPEVSPDDEMLRAVQEFLERFRG